MTEKFFDEINDLKSDVITFSWFAEQMLKNSIEALINLDKNLAKDIDNNFYTIETFMKYIAEGRVNTFK